PSLHSFPTRRSSDLVEGREREKAHAQHVARLGTPDPDRPDDGVRASARVFTAELRLLLNRDAPLEAVQEMRPRVRIHHGVAGIEDRKSTRLNSSHVS